MTDPTAVALLRDAENYLSALHGSVARHDNLAANLACAGCELRDRIAAALPQLADAPLTERAALRDRIAEALYESCTTEAEAVGPMTDAVLAVLPPPADRAAVLLEAADAVAQYTGNDLDANAKMLRRLAAEAQQKCPSVETVPNQCGCDCEGCKHHCGAHTETEPTAESCAHCGQPIRRIRGTLAEWWVHSPGGQAFCYPWQPARSTRATPGPAVPVQPAADDNSEETGA